MTLWLKNNKKRFQWKAEVSRRDKKDMIQLSIRDTLYIPRYKKLKLIRWKYIFYANSNWRQLRCLYYYQTVLFCFLIWFLFYFEVYLFYNVVLASDVQQSGSVQFSSVAQSCPTLCNPMDRSTPGLPVHHQLPEFTQIHVHRVGDAIQPSHPRSSPSPPAPNPSQHQSLFQWVNSSHEVAKVLEFQL